MPGEVLRSGRRALSDDDRQPVKTRKRNPAARDKLSTQKAIAIHGDLKEAELILLGQSDDDNDDDAMEE